MKLKIAIGALVLAVLFLVFVTPKSSSRSNQQAEPQDTTYHPGMGPRAVRVEVYLKTHVKDPDSLQIIEWGQEVELSSGHYAIWCKWRAKNSFGGYTVEDRNFLLEGDKVTLVEDLPQ